MSQEAEMGDAEGWKVTWKLVLEILKEEENANASGAFDATSNPESNPSSVGLELNKPKSLKDGSTARTPPTRPLLTTTTLFWSWNDKSSRSPWRSEWLHPLLHWHGSTSQATTPTKACWTGAETRRWFTVFAQWQRSPTTWCTSGATHSPGRQALAFMFVWGRRRGMKAGKGSGRGGWSGCSRAIGGWRWREVSWGTLTLPWGSLRPSTPRSATGSTEIQVSVKRSELPEQWKKDLTSLFKTLRSQNWS